MALELSAASGTDAGLVRNANEDAAFAAIQPQNGGGRAGLLIVADGIGGHQAGEIASQLAVETIHEALVDELAGIARARTADHPAPAEDPRLDNGRIQHAQELLKIAIERANIAIHTYAQNHPFEAGNLGTTVACAVLTREIAIIANVGDSRVYLLRNSELTQLTDDHSYVGKLVRNGQLRPDAIYDHPHRSIITRALGYQPEVRVDFISQPLTPGDMLLLCTDGLWEMVREDDEITAILESSDTPQEAVQRLIAAAKAKGGIDNIGVVVCQLHGT